MKSSEILRYVASAERAVEARRDAVKLTTPLPSPNGKTRVFVSTPQEGQGYAKLLESDKDE